MFTDYIGNALLSLEISTISSIILLAIFIGIWHLWNKNKGLPPGPYGLPYLGYWPFLREDNDIHLQLEEMSKNFGDVFSFTVTGRLYIHLGSMRAVKEAHIMKSDCFRDRYSAFNVITFTFGEGIFNQNGERWKVLRKFFNQAFRDWGMISMKDNISDPIQQSVECTIKYLTDTQGEAINICDILSDECSKVIHQLFFRDGILTAEEIKAMNLAYLDVQTRLLGRRHLVIGDIAKYTIFRLTPGYRSASESHKFFVEKLRKLVRQHKETFDENNVRNIIDSYLKEQYERQKKSDPSAEYFTENTLVYSLVQFIGDGVADSAILTTYFIEGLLDRPEEQERIYQELRDVIGPNRQPVVEDRPNLPYTNAFILELTRTSDFFNFFPSLECTRETTIGGYRVPKGTITLLNMWTAHHDPNVYEEPHQFRPSRYLEKGRSKLDTSLIFGIGKRACSGEPLIMTLVFLFVTTIVFNFKLSSPEKVGNVSPFDRQLMICVHPRDRK